MKTTIKIIGAIGITAIFLAMAFIPILSTDVSSEVYNTDVDNYILSIDYDPDNCIVSTDGVSVQKQYTWEGDDSCTTTTKYTKQTVSNNGSSVLENIGAQSTKVFPGAILKADTDLANGTPNAITGLSRTNLTLSSTLNGATSKTIDPSNYDNYKNAVSEMIDEWAKTGVSPSLNYTEQCETGYSSKQLSIELGISLDFLSGIGIGVNWTETTESQTCVFEYSRQFYSVSSSSYVHPGSYFARNVSVDDVKLRFADSPTVLVQNATYGMMILFQATSSSTNTDLSVALNLAIEGHSGDLTVEQKEALENSSFTMTVIGGTQSGNPVSYSKGKYTEFIDDLRSYLVQDVVGADDFKNATLLSAETSFLDSGDMASSFVSTEYVEKTTELTTSIDVRFLMDGGYCGTFKVKYYAYDSIDENGNYVNGREEEMGWSWETRVLDASKTITAKHYGPFKIYARAEWGSVVLDWYTINVPLDSIYLWEGGTSFNVDYELKVDDVTIKRVG